MLGKRPHQIQRTTSMSQLRVPPGARTRPTSEFAQAKKDLLSQMASNPSVYTKKASAHHTHPKAQEDAPHVEMKIEGTMCNANKVNIDVSPIVHTHAHGHSKASHLPLRVASVSPLPLLAKHTISESFMDACYSCKSPLDDGRDIFMYRGDAAFCTEECRLRQISCDERRQKCLLPVSESTSCESTVGNPNGA